MISPGAPSATFSDCTSCTCDEVPLEHFFGLKFAAGITPNYGITANYRFKTETYFETGVAVKDAESYGYGALGFSMNF